MSAIGILATHASDLMTHWCLASTFNPSTRSWRILLSTTTVVMLVVYVVMSIVYNASGDRSNMMASQLSFSDVYLKWQYSQMTPAGLMAYTLAQQVDFLFMGTYALFTWLTCTTLALKFTGNSAWRTTGCLLAVLGPLAASLDAMENVFILLTLSDPVTFPAWYAIAHSTAALIKWLILVSFLGWATGAVVKLRLGSKKEKKEIK